MLSKSSFGPKSGSAKTRSGARKTSVRCSLRKEFVPHRAAALGRHRWVDSNIGPIPKGTPINLLANLEPDFRQLVVLKIKISKALGENSRAESLTRSLNCRAA